MQAPNWETYDHGNMIEACYLNATSEHSECEQGSVPAVGVGARVLGDIVAAVGFATSWGLRVFLRVQGELKIVVYHLWRGDN